MEAKLEVGSDGQFSPSVLPHNPATGFRPPSATVVSAEPFCTEQGHCGACRRKWRLTDTDLCPCGETQTMSHIVESGPLTKLNGGLSRLHSAAENAVSWLTNYGSWNAYEKKKTEAWKHHKMRSKCPLWALTQAERRQRHWLMAGTIIEWSSFLHSTNSRCFSSARRH